MIMSKFLAFFRLMLLVTLEFQPFCLLFVFNSSGLLLYCIPPLQVRIFNKYGPGSTTL